MKTTALLLVVGLSTITSVAMAQAQGSATKKTGNEWHAAGEAIPRSKAFATKVDSVAHLDASLKTKVFQTYLANTKSVDEIRLGSRTAEEKKALLDQNKVDFDLKMKAILPADKYLKYQKIAGSL